MSGVVTIRAARLFDRDAALALWAQLQADHEALDARHRPSASARDRWGNDFGVWVGSDADCVYVAEAAGEVIGLVTAHTYWPAPVYEQEMEVYLTELVVAPEHRSARIGEQLVEAVCGWARDLGVRQIRVGVLSRNARGRAFWARLGADDFFTTVTLPADLSL